MRILLTGATGFIGSEVARRLVADGHRARAMVRRPSRAALLATLDVEPVYGDLLSPASLARAVDGVDAVIHLGARATFEPYARLQPTIVDGTAQLAQAAAEAGVRHIVYGSSMFVYDGTAPVDDRTPARPTLAYGRAKLDAEAVLDRTARAGGPSVACIRLPHVYGPQSLLFGLVRRRVVVFPGAGDNEFAQLHVDDAARVLVAAAVQGWCGTAPLADHATVTWNDFFDVLTTFAPRIRVLRLPRRLAAAGAAVGGALLGRLGPTLVSVDTVRGWNLRLAVTSRTLWSDLGMSPRYPGIFEGVPATLDGVVAFRWRHPVSDRS
ncbi:MAG TPA: NAD-dependent epimerase/dehydratase family protein [Acidimicrobiales bacterium]